MLPNQIPNTKWKKISTQDGDGPVSYSIRYVNMYFDIRSNIKEIIIVIDRKTGIYSIYAFGSSKLMLEEAAKDNLIIKLKSGDVAGIQMNETEIERDENRLRACVSLFHQFESLDEIKEDIYSNFMISEKSKLQLVNLYISVGEHIKAVALAKQCQAYGYNNIIWGLAEWFYQKVFIDHAIDLYKSIYEQSPYHGQANLRLLSLIHHIKPNYTIEDQMELAIKSGNQIFIDQLFHQLSGNNVPTKNIKGDLHTLVGLSGLVRRCNQNQQVQYQNEVADQQNYLNTDCINEIIELEKMLSEDVATKDADPKSTQITSSTENINCNTNQTPPKKWLKAISTSFIEKYTNQDFSLTTGTSHISSITVQKRILPPQNIKTYEIWAHDPSETLRQAAVHSSLMFMVNGCVGIKTFDNAMIKPFIKLFDQYESFNEIKDELYAFFDFDLELIKAEEVSDYVEKGQFSKAIEIAKQAQLCGQHELIWALAEQLHSECLVDDKALKAIYDKALIDIYQNISQTSPYYKEANHRLFVLLDHNHVNINNNNVYALLEMKLEAAINSGEKTLVDQSFHKLCGYNDMLPLLRDINADKHTLICVIHRHRFNFLMIKSS